MALIAASRYRPVVMVAASGNVATAGTAYPTIQVTAIVAAQIAT